MLNKIDKNLINKISSAENKNRNTNVIVYLKNYEQSIKRIERDYKQIIKLPMISSVAINIDNNKIVSMARNEYINYIAEAGKVCTLTYNSKKFMNLDCLLSYPIRGKSTIVVVDTGIYPHIDFLLGKNRVIKFVDLINYRQKMYDDNGHGTFVSGVACGWGIVNKYGGIDKNCGLVVIKALDKNGETDTSKILEAMQWILDNKEEYGITTVCMSFGSVYRNGDPLITGAEVLWKNGIVVVTAGGNSGPDVSTIMSPGTSRRVITVGSLNSALDNEISVADFSSRGPVNNYYKPDLVVPGTDIVSTSIFDTKKSFYTRMSGTSVSTPMVAGVCSILKSINPEYTPDQIKYMLISACTPIEYDRNKEGFGYLDLKKLRLIETTHY